MENSVCHQRNKSYFKIYSNRGGKVILIVTKLLCKELCKELTECSLGEYKIIISKTF